MENIKIQIQYNGNNYEFDDGLKAYIFTLAISCNAFKIESEHMNRLVDKVYSVASIPNTTWVEDIFNYIIENWERLAELDADDVFDDFAWHKEDN